MSSPALSIPARPLLQVDLDASTLGAAWGHCDRIANYLARLASFDRSDAFLYGNLFSTVLNELFEIVFFQHETPGTVRCTLLRADGADRIELEIPADDAQRTVYEKSVALAQSAQAGETYTRAMLGEDAQDRSIGFLELATDYGAGIHLESGLPGGPLRLIVEVRLEDGPPSLTSVSQ